MLQCNQNRCKQKTTYYTSFSLCQHPDKSLLCCLRKSISTLICSLTYLLNVIMRFVNVLILVFVKLEVICYGNNLSTMLVELVKSKCILFWVIFLTLFEVRHDVIRSWKSRCRFNILIGKDLPKGTFLTNYILSLII